MTDRWTWPLPGCYAPVPLRPDAHAFGVVRKHDVHTGVDLVCADGQPVHAVLGGIVTRVVGFTGASVGSPWWNETVAVLVVTEKLGCVLYGELDPASFNIGSPGTTLRAGGFVGRVRRVRRVDDGRPSSMLHLEWWASLHDVMQRYLEGRDREANDWVIGDKVPVGLLDPTEKLVEALQCAEGRGRDVP